MNGEALYEMWRDHFPGRPNWWALDAELKRQWEAFAIDLNKHYKHYKEYE